MRTRLRSDRPIAAITGAILTLNLIFCHFARAEPVADYSKVGWWQIQYKQVDTVIGCQASAQFQDKTTVTLALIAEAGKRAWVVFLFKPSWSSWIGKRKEHTLRIATVNPTKRWRGPWQVNDNKALFLIARTEFINAIADAEGLAIFDDNNRLLTDPPLSMKDSEDAIKAVVNCVRDHPTSSSPPISQTLPQPPSTTSSSGTAFFVAPNLVITNNHVVKECGNNIQVRYPERRSYGATISGQDDNNDLALLQTDMASEAVASFRFGPRLGEAVATYGFPYPTELSSSGSFTLGSITSLSGLKNDSRFVQIQAPVQPGNSGGPLLDMSARVLGIVRGMLSPVAMIERYGSIPQNVNFAIQTPIVINFLMAKGVTPKLDTSTTSRDLDSADVADLAKKFTVQIYCPTASPKISGPAAVPEASAEALEQKAKDFVLWMEAKWSGSNTEAIAGLEELYDADVMYYGKVTRREAVIKEKQAFVRKFPERRYTVREPMFVRCRDDICTVSGTLDFRSVDPRAGMVSQGVASFEYEMGMSGISPRIRLENGTVLSRTRTPISSGSMGESAGSNVTSGSGRAQ